MNHIFSTEGHFLNALSDFSMLVFLNLLTLLCSIPVITAGAAYASLHYSVQKLAEGEGGVLKGYWGQFRANLRDVTPVWLLMLVLACFLGLDYYMVTKQEGELEKLLFMLVTVAFLGYLMLFVWVFPLCSRFQYSVRAALRNALLLSVAKFPRTLGMIFFTAFVPVLVLMNPRLYPILFFVGLSLPAYLSQFLYSRVLKELMEKR